MNTNMDNNEKSENYNYAVSEYKNMPKSDFNILGRYTFTIFNTVLNKKPLIYNRF